MKIQTQLKVVAGLVAGLLVAGNVQAETVQVDATVSVDTSIDVTIDQVLSFGTIAAFEGSAGHSSALTIPSDPTGTASVAQSGTAANSNIVQLTDGTPAIVSVAGAAPLYFLSLTLPSTGLDVEDPSGTNADKFLLNNFTKYATVSGGGDTSTQTDADGNYTVRIGADLVTTATADVNGTAYTNSTYTVKFPVIISY